MQPAPAVNDTNPYNVFRPREKAHRLHTRRVSGEILLFWLYFGFGKMHFPEFSIYENLCSTFG